MYVISAHQRYRQTDGQTDAKRWHDRSIAILAWCGKKLNRIICKTLEKTKSYKIIWHKDIINT